VKTDNHQVLPLFNFAFCAIKNKNHPEKEKSFDEFLRELAALSMPEDWGGTTNPILNKYIHHTFKRLKSEYDSNSSDNKQRIIKTTDKFACFNTGLFTQGYQPIFALFEKNYNATESYHKPWYLRGFVDESNNRLIVFGSDLPERASYFSDIGDLIFDYRLEIRANLEHILADDENLQRVPTGLQDGSNRQKLNTAFLGALEIAKKRVTANYKLAVPQFFNGSIQLLIPLHLMGEEKPDLALAIKKQNGLYMGRTCLTLDMAYNNARLIAKPESDWLAPTQHN